MGWGQQEVAAQRRVMMITSMAWKMAVMVVACYMMVVVMALMSSQVGICLQHQLLQVPVLGAHLQLRCLASSSSSSSK
jgi:hypothetical protein